MTTIVQWPNTNLGDVPAMLRKLADDIETSITEPCSSAIVLLPREQDYPVIFGFGDVEGNNQPLVQLALAHSWFIYNLTSRR